MELFLLKMLKNKIANCKTNKLIAPKPSLNLKNVITSYLVKP